MPAKDFTEFREVKLVPGIKPMTDYTDAESHSWGEYFACLPSTSQFILPDVCPVDAFSKRTDFIKWFEAFRAQGIRPYVEVNLDENSRWVAQIVQVAGYRLKLKLLNTEPMPPAEFWVNWGSTDLMPVGHTFKCQQSTLGRKVTLKPPIGSDLLKLTEDERLDKLMNILLNSCTLPIDLVKSKVNALNHTRFKVGDRLEVLNSSNSSEVRPAIVKNICGKRMFLALSLIDSRPSPSSDPQWSEGIYINQDSPILFPVGWAVEAGYGIGANDDYIAHCEKILQAKRNKRKPNCFEERDARPEKFLASDENDFKPSGEWKAGDCVEVLDPLDSKFQSLRAGHIKKVLHDGYVLISFENATHEVFPIHGASSNLHQPGYAAKYGLKLEAPKFKRGPKFDWLAYVQRLKKTKKENRSFADEGMFRPVPEYVADRFVPGAKLEAADQVEARIVCPASVREARGRTVIVSFDGWSKEFDQYFDCESTDLMPVGWAEMNGYFLSPPPVQNFSAANTPSERASSNNSEIDVKTEMSHSRGRKRSISSQDSLERLKKGKKRVKEELLA